MPVFISPATKQYPGEPVNHHHEQSKDRKIGKKRVILSHYLYNKRNKQGKSVSKFLTRERIKEGLPEIAGRLRAISKAEEHHEERYKKLLKELKNGTLFKKNKKVTWVCRKCGYTHEGEVPTKKCPSCNHESGCFEVKCEEC